MRRSDKKITEKGVIFRLLSSLKTVRIGHFINDEPLITPLALLHSSNCALTVNNEDIFGAVSFQTDLSYGFMKKNPSPCSCTTRYMSIYGRGRKDGNKISINFISGKFSSLYENEIEKRENPPLFIKEKIDINKVNEIRLGIRDKNEIYIVPVNIASINDCLYFHSAKTGRKIELLRKWGNIIIEGEEKDENNNLTKWRNFKAKAEIVSDNSEKCEAIGAITKNLIGEKHIFLPDMLKNTEIVRITI